MNNEIPTPSPQPEITSGKSVLLDRISILREQANNLQILHDALPDNLTKEQDYAIWSIAVNIPLR